MENEIPKTEGAKPAEIQKVNWPDVLQKTEELAARIEKANIESRKILEQQQEITARNLLGGFTDAGVQPTPVKEETPAEYAKRILTGKR